jgi:hypothetical protein
MNSSRLLPRHRHYNGLKESLTYRWCSKMAETIQTTRTAVIRTTAIAPTTTANLAMLAPLWSLPRRNSLRAIIPSTRPTTEKGPQPQQIPPKALHMAQFASSRPRFECASAAFAATVAAVAAIPAGDRSHSSCACCRSRRSSSRCRFFSSSRLRASSSLARTSRQ